MDGRTDSSLNLAGGSSKGGSKWLMIIVVILIALIALVAVIVAAVALGRSRTPNVTVNSPDSSSSGQAGAGGGSGGSGTSTGSGSSSSTGAVCPRIYTIARGHDWGAYEYFDSRGYLVGFAQEVVDAACRAAGMQCEIVWDEYTNCWDSAAGSHPTGGEGLFDRWYDACTGWGMTIDRMHVFDFSLPFIKSAKSYFFIKPGREFDQSDLSGKTIAFFDGWYSDEKCLARYQDDNHRNYILEQDKIRHVTAGPRDVVDLLINEQVDALFAGAHDMDSYVQSGQLERLSEGFQCTYGGHAMMTRRDSPFNAAWNMGLKKIRANGVYRDLCTAARNNHANEGSIECLD